MSGLNLLPMPVGEQNPNLHPAGVSLGSGIPPVIVLNRRPEAARNRPLEFPELLRWSSLAAQARSAHLRCRSPGFGTGPSRTLKPLVPRGGSSGAGPMAVIRVVGGLRQCLSRRQQRVQRCMHSMGCTATLLAAQLVEPDLMNCFAVRPSTGTGIRFMFHGRPPITFFSQMSPRA